MRYEIVSVSNVFNLFVIFVSFTKGITTLFGLGLGQLLQACYLLWAGSIAKQLESTQTATKKIQISNKACTSALCNKETAMTSILDRIQSTDMPTVFAACSDALTLAVANRESPVILFKLLDPGLETSAGCIDCRNSNSNHVNAKPNPIQKQDRKEKRNRNPQTGSRKQRHPC
jgi:hypothetical protein